MRTMGLALPRNLTTSLFYSTNFEDEVSQTALDDVKDLNSQISSLQTMPPVNIEPALMDDESFDLDEPTTDLVNKNNIVMTTEEVRTYEDTFNIKDWLPLIQKTSKTEFNGKRIDNSLPKSLYPNAKHHALYVITPLKTKFPGLYINSWYRHPTVNAKIYQEADDAKKKKDPTYKGKSVEELLKQFSHHEKGATTDLSVRDENGNVLEDETRRLFIFIRDNIPYKELIWEGGSKTAPRWVHLASYPPGGNQKGSIKVIGVSGLSSNDKKDFLEEISTILT